MMLFVEISFIAVLICAYVYIMYFQTVKQYTQWIVGFIAIAAFLYFIVADPDKAMTGLQLLQQFLL